MKSIFFVIVFIILATMVSQPDKAEVKYIPFSVSVPHSFMQNDLSKDFSISFTPKADTNTYDITLNNEISRIIKSRNISFLFSDCKLKQRPNLSLSCKLKDTSGSEVSVTSLSIKPMITIGQEKVDFYIIQFSKMSASGNSEDYQFFTKSRYVIAGQDSLNLKVSQN